MLFESQIAKVNENGYREIEKEVPKEELQAFRKRFAQVVLDFWFMAEASDGYVQREERDMIMSFIKLLFRDDSLFPSKEYDELIRQNLLLELTSRDRKRASLKEIANFARKNSIFSIIHADGRVLTKESNFLKEFLNLLGMSENSLITMMESYKKK
ncbi:MAG: hypothetical protein N3A69_09075 [Leptospiraceae bacterium]|nr:hypothetical protein [Leptospiraceae bacterium]